MDDKDKKPKEEEKDLDEVVSDNFFIATTAVKEAEKKKSGD